MKKVALVFVLAVFVPSLVLAWLAVRSLRDQQFLLERQESLLYEGTADGMVKDVLGALDNIQRTFVTQVATLVGNQDPRETAKSFDSQLRSTWPLAEVGFVVTMSGEILAPTLQAGAQARTFLADNSRFLASRESAEVYLNTRQGFNNSLALAQNEPSASNQSDNSFAPSRKAADNSRAQRRSVIPQQIMNPSQGAATQEEQQVSKAAVSEAEFRQLIGNQNDGGTTRTLDQVIVQIRKKLGDSGEQPRHLLTVHGVGYKLVLWPRNTEH